MKRNLHRSGQLRKLCRRQFALLVCACLFTICTTAQNTNNSPIISLKHTNAELEVVLQDIADQAGMNLMFLKKPSKPVTIQATNITLTHALTLVLKDQPFTFLLKNNAIILAEKPNASGSPSIRIRGKVVNEKKQPVAGATIREKLQDNNTTQTDNNGVFELSIPSGAAVLVSSIGYQYAEITPPPSTEEQDNVVVTLQEKATELSEVIISSGYETVPPERATGAYEVINNTQLNRRVSKSIVERLEGATTGLIVNRGRTPGVPPISIRGRSTIFSNAEPLIVLDNFPYVGPIENINPNDIESVTILKDAAAASIWGAYSGNGVIVLTSKKGKLNQSPEVSFNANVTYSDKPYLSQQRMLGSREYIEVEKFLFDKGEYDVYFDFLPHWQMSPAVEVMYNKRRGLITDKDAETQLDQLRNYDYRRDYNKYFNRNALNQQYALSVRGGGLAHRYYISVGFDKNLLTQVGSEDKRYTINAKNTFLFLDNRLEINAGLMFTRSEDNSPAETYTPKYPYERVADENGNKLPTVMDYRIPFIDTADAGNLLDWKYYPLDTRKSNVAGGLQDYKINADVNYTVVKGLKASLLYQYGSGDINGNTNYDQSTYYFRNLYNLFTTIDPSTGLPAYGLPKGNIYMSTTGNYKTYSLRGLLTYSKTWGAHEISALVGAEQRETKNHNESNIKYGYSPTDESFIRVNFQQPLTTYFGYTQKISELANSNSTVDRNRAFFANASYTFKGKYLINGSIRKDEANIFGVNTNQRGVPLWSAGAAWVVTNEGFFNWPALSLLKFRATVGDNGNVNRSLYAFTTINLDNGINFYNRNIAAISNPPNPDLRWETVRTMNLAVDFVFQKILSGSIEYYTKDGNDLIGIIPTAPQVGVSEYKGNVARTKSKGTEIKLNSVNINKGVKWETGLNFTYSSDKVSENLTGDLTNQIYVTNNVNNPLEDYPFNAVFSFKYAGLDSIGDPMGYAEGKETKNYAAILAEKNTKALVYHGSTTPLYFGNLRNTISYKSFGLYLNVTYKFAYYFRTNALSYSALFNNGFIYQQDYTERWKQPGDEKTTSVPSMKYPANGYRDLFYRLTDAHVHKGDHVRLQDVQLTYDLPSSVLKKVSLSKLRVYANMANVLMLWKANKVDADPDTGGGIRLPRTYSIGISCSF